LSDNKRERTPGKKGGIAATPLRLNSYIAAGRLGGRYYAGWLARGVSKKVGKKIGTKKYITIRAKLIAKLQYYNRGLANS